MQFKILLGFPVEVARKCSLESKRLVENENQLRRPSPRGRRQQGSVGSVTHELMHIPILEQETFRSAGEDSAPGSLQLLVEN